MISVKSEYTYTFGFLEIAQSLVDWSVLLLQLIDDPC